MKAIILAAGKGTRLLPLTQLKPKPLLEIKGKSLLEHTIFHLRKCGFDEIVVVTGYKHSLFTPLEKTLNFRQIVFKDYDSTNSAASLKYVCTEIQKGTLIINGDLYLDANFSYLFEKHIKRGVCQILAQKILNQQPSWGYIIDENCRLLDIDTNATSGYGDGIVFLDNAEEIKLFKTALKACKDSEYWEASLLNSLDGLPFYAFFIDSLYCEIDSFKDALLAKLITPEEIAKQCSDDGNIKRLFSVTNINYHITHQRKEKVIRIPRNHREEVLNPQIEQQIITLLPRSITPESEFYPSGIKCTNFLKGYQPLDFKDLNQEILSKILQKIKHLHTFKHRNYPNFPPIFLTQEIQKYESLAKIPLATKQEHHCIMQIAREADQKEFVLCHRDLQLPNILYNSKEIQLIDFEFAGFCSPIWELGNFCAELALNQQQIQHCLKIYENLTEKEILQGKILSNYIWALWSWHYDCIALGREYLLRFHTDIQCYTKEYL